LLLNILENQCDTLEKFFLDKKNRVTERWISLPLNVGRSPTFAAVVYFNTHTAYGFPYQKHPRGARRHWHWHRGHDASVNTSGTAVFIPFF
jgi:hypothetical protein